MIVVEREISGEKKRRKKKRADDTRATASQRRVENGRARLTDIAGLVDVAGHDTNLALAGLDDAGAVGAFGGVGDDDDDDDDDKG